jgi:hypothetical protein
MKDDFDASAELAAIKEHRMMARRKLYRSSKLMPFRSELVQLRRSGATIGDLVLWLRQKINRDTPNLMSCFVEKSGLPLKMEF